ncbi:hypothetical protein ACP275_06G208400 [Erythranthe tilingii]
MNNNWLFSAQELQQHDQSQNNNSVPAGHHDNNHLALNFNGSDDISSVVAPTTVDDESSSCFDHLIPCLKNHLPPPNPHFPFSQPFNSTNYSHHSQDWNMNSLSCSSSSSHNLDNNNNNSNQNKNSPKLENFLGFGGHTFADQLQQHNKLICNNTYTNMYQQTQAATTNNNNSTIGLSMIKNWLRKNPSAKTDGDVAGGGAQTLSLSMSTGCSQTSSPLPLVVVGNIAAAATEIVSCTSESSKDDGQSVGGALLEYSVPRKSVETFGQRTSIYRGVTRHRWTGRYEAHLWDNTCRREGQTRKGRQGFQLVLINSGFLVSFSNLPALGGD